MKILIPINGFSRSGGARVLSKIANELIKSGDSVDFLVPKPASVPYYPTDANIITYSNIFSNIRGLRSIANVVNSYLWMVKESVKYDVVLANHHVTSFPVWAATREKNNGFYYIQAYEPEMYKKSSFSFLYEWIAKKSYYLNLHRIVNAPIYKSFKEIRAEYVVEPGIDLDVYNSIDKKKHSGVVKIACIGRKGSFKGTKEIIEAVEQFSIEHKITLDVAFELPDGIDPMAYEFLKVSQPHGDTNLAAFYKQADIVVATGLLQDGAFHYPCLEALACGCRVISNYSPANKDNAFVIHEVTVDKILLALRLAVNSDDSAVLSKKEQSWKDVQKYAWKNIGEKMRVIFESHMKI